jgi:hypothetical protein
MSFNAQARILNIVGRTYAAILGLIALTSTVFGGSAADALQNFGLPGTWSPDCAIDPHEACRRVGDKVSCGFRVTYAAPWFGAPTRTTIQGTSGGMPRTTVEKISSAVVVTNNKLKYTYILEGEPPTISKVPWLPQNGETWEHVLEKRNDRLQSIIFKRVDGKKTMVEDGFIYSPTEEAKAKWRQGEMPSQWTNTGRPSNTIERCRE